MSARRKYMRVATGMYGFFDRCVIWIDVPEKLIECQRRGMPPCELRVFARRAISELRNYVGHDMTIIARMNGIPATQKATSDAN